MPPKAKFTKEQIIDAALQITRESGIEAVTARAIGTALTSSARPIFTVFNNMEELLCETVNAVRDIYNSYIALGLNDKIAIKGVGKAYILFAQNEPNFFRLLFMAPNNTTNVLSSILPAIDENSDKILASIMNPYGLDKERAYELYKYLWIFSHGIATLCATNVCKFTSDEISELLTNEFKGILIKMRMEEQNDKS